MSVKTSGPFFVQGNRAAVLADLRHDARREVASQALAEVHHELNASIRHPTPYYETQIKLEDLGADTVVHDSGVIYGPWLEGTGSRNRTTRFKGYASFRKAAQRLEWYKAERVLKRPLARAIARLS